jgi:hypothetical protein
VWAQLVQTRAWISRPHDGQIRRRCLHSNALFRKPAVIITQPIAIVRTTSIAM